MAAWKGIGIINFDLRGFDEYCYLLVLNTVEGFLNRVAPGFKTPCPFNHGPSNIACGFARDYSMLVHFPKSPLSHRKYPFTTRYAFSNTSVRKQEKIKDLPEWIIHSHTGDHPHKLVA